ncbi:MAG: methionine gamma-lyase family protein [Clostridiales bacterium]|nr:methionine gamma-lyase family protein [Clostridiales bacterium]
MSNPFRAFGVSDAVIKASEEVRDTIAPAILQIERIREFNQLRVLDAFRKARVSESDFGISTGYGYDDIGRDKIEKIYAAVFGGESAYVRIQISCGTQALAACLFGILRPKDKMVSVTGTPYDTLATAIGIAKNNEPRIPGSLLDYGIEYAEVALLPDDSPDLAAIRAAVDCDTRLVFIQKSKGYSDRRCLMGSEIRSVISAVRAAGSDAVILVDNCYGEFVEEEEPCSYGADLCAGSLIKNPGGGLCPSGGYIVGRRDLVEAAAFRLSAPGVGRHVGPSLGFNRTIAQGLFMAPHVVAESLKGAVFASALFRKAGFDTSPGPMDPRGDIIQSIRFHGPEQLKEFCRIVQACSPVDSFVTPEPWAMPGYDVPVIMAAGTFVQGSSIEFSADGPIKSPYNAYMQGGLVSEQICLAAMIAVDKMGEQSV